MVGTQGGAAVVRCSKSLAYSWLGFKHPLFSSAADLVLHSAEAFFAAQDLENIENARRSRPSGECRPQRLRDLPEFDPGFLDILTHRRFRRLRRPVREIDKTPHECGNMRASAVLENRICLLVELQGPLGK